MIKYCCLLVMAAILSCSKNEGLFAGHASILGRWMIVADTTHVGVGLNNHQQVFRGGKQDYFYFGSDNELIINEGGFRESVKFTQTSDTTLVIDAFNGVMPNQHCILHLTSHAAVISTGDSFTPGGIFGRTVRLSR